ncbi:hypothetical protein LB504_006894 [Fusarium proliferatum]|nr:hypothetical protein LB504_006894 [Fusarium proliferatum]
MSVYLSGFRDFSGDRLLAPRHRYTTGDCGLAVEYLPCMKYRINFKNFRIKQEMAMNPRARETQDSRQAIV